MFEKTEIDYDNEDAKAMGSIFAKYLADSESQLILDLDLFKHFFNYAEAYRMGAVEGDVEIMKYAVRIVEKLKQFDVSTACVGDMLHLGWTAVEYATHVEEHKNCSDCKCTPLFQQKKTERHWIFNVLDAMGKVPSGITSGNNLWVGSWNTCRNIRVVKNQQGQVWKGQYCMARVHAYERDNPLNSLGDGGPIDGHCFEEPKVVNETEDAQCFGLFPLLNFGICVPNSCTDHDVTRMLSFAIRMTEGGLGVDKVCDLTVECRNEKEENSMSKNPLAMFALYLVIATVVIIIFGTLYDLFIAQNEPSGDAEQHPFIKFILAYSVYRNGSEILVSKRKAGEINPLHGVRFLSMSWIILGHTYYYIGSSLTTDNLIPTLINFPQQFYTQVIVQAPLAVDSFFFLSGMLAAFSFFKRFLNTERPRKGLNNPYNPLVWLLYDLKRYTRITPTYIVVMLLDVTLFTYISDGPFWRPIERQGCRHAWWTNLIYLNNFLLQDVECCMGWTWYLANDFQFHVVLMPILVMSFIKWGEKIGMYISGGLMLISSIIKVVIIEINDFPPAPLLTAKLQIVKQLDSYWSHVYVRPYVRCTPFIIGVMVAYLLNAWRDPAQRELRVHLKKKTVAAWWIASTILGLYSIFGLYYFAKTGDISEWWKVLYILIGRPAYAVALGWVVFACTSGNGGPVDKILSWRFFVPLSRITFCAYLVHPIMLQIYNLSRPQPFHFTTFMQMLRHTLEAIFVSYLVAFFFSLAFEKPFNKIDEMLLPSGRVKDAANGKTKEVVEEPLQPIQRPLLSS